MDGQTNHLMSFKRTIKHLFVKTNALSILDRLNYYAALLRHSSANKKFRQLHPGFPIPPDYFLYETYRLDYRQYKEDGELTARELIGWTAPYAGEPLRILDWGCGVARVTRHFPAVTNGTATVVGADINATMIGWDAAHIHGIRFTTIPYDPPAPFTDGQFNLVFGLSVFTHIETTVQLQWLAEMHRVLAVNGVFLFTTHGSHYQHSLSAREKETLHTAGAVTISYRQKGHRMMTTYNHAAHFKTQLEKYYRVLEYYEGNAHPEKAGGQDLWIVQKIQP